MENHMSVCVCVTKKNTNKYTVRSMQQRPLGHITYKVKQPYLFRKINK